MNAGNNKIAEDPLADSREAPGVHRVRIHIIRKLRRKKSVEIEKLSLSTGFHSKHHLSTAENIAKIGIKHNIRGDVVFTEREFALAEGGEVRQRMISRSGCTAMASQDGRHAGP